MSRARSAWDVREVLSQLEQPAAFQPYLKIVREHFKPVWTQLQELVKLLALSVPEAFGAENLTSVPMALMLKKLQLWQENAEALSKWIGYQVRRRRLEKENLEPIVLQLHMIGRLIMLRILSALRSRRTTKLWSDSSTGCGASSSWRSPARPSSHDHWIEEFRKLDRARIEMARAEVAKVHHDGIPRNASGGEMAVIRREIEKKRRHKPIRQLVKDAGTALQAIKPVFMMSPLSVAQFLEPGAISFDLLLMDEASQVSPVDALRAAMAEGTKPVRQTRRGVQDDVQLPPTRFFAKMLDDSQVSDDEDELNAGDLESVLGLCLAQGLPQRMLRWHYRSRHHSLIAVSNHEFYENPPVLASCPAPRP